ncbi:MAG TPA: SpoIIE family protein phosphatase [Gemmatimonadales bacterium]|jgi:serine/threonine protein phosphatase PrpC|nr:SpoIIE family protein phosphatase [Gemmatimonadales bacterium]
MAAGPLLEWGVAARPLPGEHESGDHFLVKTFEDGAALAVVDGLGHGAEAAAAARRAVATVEAAARDPLPTLFRRCHDALVGTRGVVMSTAIIELRQSPQVTWAGVGNVDAWLLRPHAEGGKVRTSLVPRGGVLGREVPPLTPVTLPLDPGDLLVFATDGVRDGFIEAVSLQDAPQRAAGRILATHGKGTDDALVLVAKYLGRA